MEMVSTELILKVRSLRLHECVFKPVFVWFKYTGDKVVLCVNNLGGLSCLEIAVVSKVAVHCLGETL